MTKKSLRGYTLFELLIVIAMVAILATIAYPVFIGVQERGKALKDLNNLRQIGVLTQLYINDNNGVLFSPATSWMSQLYQKDGSKYVSSWDVFLSPLDNLVSPRTASVNDANSAVSYGVNPNIYPPNNNPPPNYTALSVTKITIPTAFILFAPAQDSSNVVKFKGTADTTSQPDPTSLAASPNVTVLVPTPPAPPLPCTQCAQSSPPVEYATGGTHSSRQQINALFADWHAENMLWTTFTNTTALSSDASAGLRWVPYIPYP
jgi:prepilin-type N-terminal cleavage/methylation domain-containing protein/prepilin-type processing-associated H-X9-DG protein